ncbi:MAG: EamA family transporter [Epsilonproteobacteria bacterium]|nr:EamA family transporter [Campylobacterota bacterium]
MKNNNSFKPESADNKKGLIEMIGATFIWGSTPLMSIWSGLPSGVFVFFRVVFAFPFIFYFAIKRAGIKEFFKLKPFWPLFVSGIALGVNWVFFFWAVNTIDVASAVSIYYLGPIISMLLAIWFLKERGNFYIYISGVLAVIGAVVAAGGVHFQEGIIVAFLAAVSYGALGFFSKIATMHHRAVAVTAWQILISIFITAPFLFLNDWHLSLQGIIVAFITGVIHTALALFLWYDALNYIKVSIASILQYLDIVFAMILAFLFLGQVPQIHQILGAGLIIIAGILSTFKEKAKK